MQAMANTMQGRATRTLAVTGSSLPTRMKAMLMMSKVRLDAVLGWYSRHVMNSVVCP